MRALEGLSNRRKPSSVINDISVHPHLAFHLTHSALGQKVTPLMLPKCIPGNIFRYVCEPRTRLAGLHRKRNATSSCQTPPGPSWVLSLTFMSQLLASLVAAGDVIFHRFTPNEFFPFVFKQRSRWRKAAARCHLPRLVLQLRGLEWKRLRTYQPNWKDTQRCQPTAMSK